MWNIIHDCNKVAIEHICNICFDQAIPEMLPKRFTVLDRPTVHTVASSQALQQQGESIEANPPTLMAPINRCNSIINTIRQRHQVQERTPQFPDTDFVSLNSDTPLEDVMSNICPSTLGEMLFIVRRYREDRLDILHGLPLTDVNEGDGTVPHLLQWLMFAECLDKFPLLITSTIINN